MAESKKPKDDPKEEPKEESKSTVEPDEETSEPTGGMTRLYRSTSNKMIAGICGGIGEYFNIDPTLVRILFAISVFFGGFGVLAYIVGWIIIPEGRYEPSQAKVVASSGASPTLGLIIGIGLILIGIGMVVDRMRYWYWLPDWLDPFFSVQTFFALLLIGVGVMFIFFMFRNGESKSREGSGEVFGQKGTLYRSTTDKKLSGVCGGIGEYFKIDPTIVRVFWIVVTLSTGVVPGLIIYFVLAIAVPERPLVQEDTV